MAGCLVSSVVVHKNDRDNPIGRAFYTYARERGLDPGRGRAAQEDFLLRQQSAAAKFWAGRRRLARHASSSPTGAGSEVTHPGRRSSEEPLEVVDAELVDEYPADPPHRSAHGPVPADGGDGPTPRPHFADEPPSRPPGTELQTWEDAVADLRDRGQR